jgi:hypothetical protein
MMIFSKGGTDSDPRKPKPHIEGILFGKDVSSMYVCQRHIFIPSGQESTDIYQTAKLMLCLLHARYVIKHKLQEFSPMYVMFPTKGECILTL